MWPQTWNMWKPARTSTEDSWVPFVFASVVSLLSCYCFLCQSMIPCAHTLAQVCALFVSSSPCFMRMLSDPRFDLSISFTFLLFISLASWTSYCLSPSSSLLWTITTRTAAEDLGTLAENEPPTGYESNDHIITEAYVEFTQESVTEQRFPETSTTMTSSSVRRSSMRAEDEPITLKEKACRRSVVVVVHESW